MGPSVTIAADHSPEFVPQLDKLGQTMKSGLGVKFHLSQTEETFKTILEYCPKYKNRNIRFQLLTTMKTSTGW